MIIVFLLGPIVATLQHKTVLIGIILMHLDIAGDLGLIIAVLNTNEPAQDVVVLNMEAIVLQQQNPQHVQLPVLKSVILVVELKQ